MMIVDDVRRREIDSLKRRTPTSGYVVDGVDDVVEWIPDEEKIPPAVSS